MLSIENNLLKNLGKNSRKIVDSEKQRKFRVLKRKRVEKMSEVLF